MPDERLETDVIKRLQAAAANVDDINVRRGDGPGDHDLPSGASGGKLTTLVLKRPRRRKRLCAPATALALTGSCLLWRLGPAMMRSTFGCAVLPDRAR